MTDVNNFAMERIELLCVQADKLGKRKRFAERELLLKEAHCLARTMDDGLDILVMTYHRYKSDSFGVSFELQHGDPELMFGGV